MWWLKADGVDVVSGLGESVRLEWSGDVDLNDGSMQRSHEAYIQRLKFIEKIGLRERITLHPDITTLESGLKDDLIFLLSGVMIITLISFFLLIALKDANNEYSSKLASGRTPQKVLFALGWSIDELSRHIDEGRQLVVQCETIKGYLERAECDIVGRNIPRQLTDLRARATQFVKGVTRLRRVAATHLLVFMISHESRNQKPYVQCLPYKGLSEAAIRALANKIIEEMVKRRMKVAGNLVYSYLHLHISSLLLTFGAHAQRGLQYSFSDATHETAKKRYQRVQCHTGFIFKMAILVKMLRSKVMA